MIDILCGCGSDAPARHATRDHAVGSDDCLTVGDVLRRANERLAARRDATFRVSTGFGGLDLLSSGLGGGELMILGGRPSMGRSSLAFNIAEHVAFDAGEAAALFTDLSAERVGRRILASRTGISLAAIRDARPEARHAQQLLDVVGLAQQAPLFVDDSAVPSIRDITVRTRRLALRTDLRLLVVCGLLESTYPEKKKGGEEAFVELAHALKMLAVDLDIAVIVLAPLKADLEKRSCKRPKLRDLPGAKAIARFADVIAFIHREWVYDQDADPRGATLIVAKSPTGLTGTVSLEIEAEFSRFVEVDRNQFG